MCVPGLLKAGTVAGIGTALAGPSLSSHAEGRGHGGMDFIEDYRLVWSLRKGEPTDQDVYDAAAWSAVIDLSCKSVAKRGKPQDFHDFARGRWRTNPPLGIVTA